MGLISIEKPTKNKFIPIYYQIANLLRRKIEQGELEPGDKLPNEMDLAKMFDVSRVTLRQALSLLEEDDLLVRERRNGTFVKKTINNPKTIHLTGIIWEDDSGQETRRVISVENVPCTPSIANFFNLSTGDEITRIHRLRMMGKKPYCHVMNYLPKELAKKVSHSDIRRSTMLKILKEKIRIPVGKIHQTFEARTADSELARHLRIGIMDPVLYVETFIFGENGDPLEYSQIYYRGNQHKYNIELLTNGEMV
ncbi:MAG TPA: hypothetical protein DDZ83_07345 [Nitrospinae bacterium]|nr:hypothetical protein [Nitrospinota bacterium]